MKLDVVPAGKEIKLSHLQARIIKADSKESALIQGTVLITQSKGMKLLQKYFCDNAIQEYEAAARILGPLTWESS